MMDNISPCPHCGGRAYLISSYSRRCNGFFVSVKCDKCGAQSRARWSETDPAELDWNTKESSNAVSAWNMRTGGEDNGGSK